MSPSNKRLAKTKEVSSSKRYQLREKPKISYKQIDKWCIENRVLPLSNVETAKKKNSTSPSSSKTVVNKKSPKSPDTTNKKVQISKTTTPKSSKTTSQRKNKSPSRKKESKASKSSPGSQQKIYQKLDKWLIDKRILPSNAVETVKKKMDTSPSNSKNAVNGKSKKLLDTGNKNIEISKTSPSRSPKTLSQTNCKLTIKKKETKDSKSSPGSPQRQKRNNTVEQSTLKKQVTKDNKRNKSLTNKLPPKSSNNIKQTTHKKEKAKENKLSNLKLLSGRSRRKNRADKSISPLKQSTLNEFLTKNANKKTIFKRYDSFDSIDLPVFTKTKRVTKAAKVKEQKSLFEKYGVVIPTVDEILSDKKDLELCKSKLSDFNLISEDSLELPVLEQLESPCKVPNLDCKHLTDKELEVYFNNNISFLSDIFSEKIKNTRHERYFNQTNKVLTFSVNDLTYNTSTIVFSYEQIRFLVKLLSKHFDPDDTRSQYLFQVLLPELCLKIFTKTHDMTEVEAVVYLDEKPVVD